MQECTKMEEWKKQKTAGPGRGGKWTSDNVWKAVKIENSKIGLLEVSARTKPF